MVQWAIKQEIDLAKGDRAGGMRQSIEPLAYPGNANAHGWRVTVYNNGLPANLSGNTITAYFKRADGNTVLVQGLASGNMAQVVFPPEVYAVPGIVHGLLNATASGQSTTALDAVSFIVRQNLTENIIDPGSVIPASIDDLLAIIGDAQEAATNAANATKYIADTFDPAERYAVGKRVIYNGKLYRFTAVHAPGAWTGTDATETQVEDDVGELKTVLINIATDIKSLLNDIAYVRTNHKAASVASDIDDIIEALNDGSSHTIIYTITKNLSYCTSTDSTSSIVENSSYITTLIADSGYTISSVTIAMGGTDITSTAYNSATSVISVPSVTGDIVITASSSQVISPTLSSISAAFNSGGSSIYENDALDSLKQYLVVTAVYSDGSSSTVASSNYVLSGTVAAGLSTITVTYEGKYTTFDVNVSLWDTEPNIAANDSYWSTTGTAETKTGLSRTELYEYDIDLTALKSSTRYDSTNDYMTVDKSVFSIRYTFANTDGISTGQVNKNVVFSGTEFAQFSSITAGAEKGFFDAKNNTIMISNSKLKLGFTLFTAGIDDSYAYFIATNSNVMPIGVSNGDIIFAGKNTPYYHKRNINEASHS